MRAARVAYFRSKRTEGSVGQIMKQLGPVMARSNATKPSRICLRCSWIASLALAMTDGQRVMARSRATKPSRIFQRCDWIASVSALKRSAGLLPGEACGASEAGSRSLAMTEVGGHRNSLRAAGFSSPSPREAVGREGRREAKARVGGSFCNPHPGSLSLADLPTRGREKRPCASVARRSAC